MHCRIDVRDLWREGGGESRLSWRLLGNLVRHLPPESATKTALRNRMSDAEIAQAAKSADPSQGQWSQLEMLMASVSDKLSWLLHITLVAKGGKPKKPEPTPRPGVKAKGKKTRPALTPDQAEAVMRRINGGDLPGRWLQSRPGRATDQPHPH
jgi:hypothetical protein